MTRLVLISYMLCSTSLFSAQREGSPYSALATANLEIEDDRCNIVITHDDFELLIKPPSSCCLPFIKKDPTIILKIKNLSFDFNLLVTKLQKQRIKRIHHLILSPQKQTQRFKTSHASIECPICFEKDDTKETVELINCNHRFHKDCLLPWISRQNSCPMCREKTGANDLTHIIEILTKFRVLNCDLSPLKDLFLSNQAENFKIKFNIYEYISFYSLFDNPSTLLFLPIEFQTNLLGMAHLNAFIKVNTHHMNDIYGNYMDDLELVQVIFLK